MHLHNKHHTVLMAPTEPELTESLLSLGITVIATQRVECLLENEQYHTDMQALIIHGTAFVPEDCTNTAEALKAFGYKIVHCKALSKKYPDNILLNVALIGDKLFCKESAVAEEIKNFSIENNIKIVNVNQGYTKCSTLVLSNNAIITADETIYKAALNNSINVLKISPGYIYLQGADYGFIGGCSGVIGDTVYFFGDINTHPESMKITEFITKQGMSYVSLNKGIMKDIGGFICL